VNAWGRKRRLRFNAVAICDRIEAAGVEPAARGDGFAAGKKGPNLKGERLGPQG
jgi:hypothetical protein